jgi:hypothetical protein
MRKIKMVGSLAAAVCVLAVAAVPASAHQFIANKLGPSIGHGFEEIVSPEFEPANMQEFKFGTFRILCYRAKLNGTITENVSETFTTTIKFAKCGWYPQNNTLHVAAGWSKSGITIVYHANGYTEAVGNGEGEEYEFKKATLLETAAYVKISSTKLCQIVIPEQTIPVIAIKNPEAPYSSALYSTIEPSATNIKYFPSGKQKRLVIKNEFKKMKFKYAGEETQCATALEFESQQKEGVTGEWKGNVEAYVQYGNLSFE